MDGSPVQFFPNPSKKTPKRSKNEFLEEEEFMAAKIDQYQASIKKKKQMLWPSNHQIKYCTLRDINLKKATKDPVLDLRKSTTEHQMEELDAGSQYGNTDLKALWVYRPPAYASSLNEDSYPRPVVLRPRHSVTKLAKTLMYGIDPYFSKDYFEFERRPKPVTLIAVRKNKLFPRKAVQSVPETTADVAELQSPYNDISSLWVEAPAET